MSTPSTRRRASNYRDLDAWQVAMDLVTAIYSVTTSFPPDERYGLTTQLRRAAVSVPSNLAEGNARVNLREYRRFVLIARGSLAEIDTQIELAMRLGYLQEPQSQPIRAYVTRVGQMLTRLAQSLIR